MFRKQHPTAGAVPGTLAVAADSPDARIRMIHYGPQGKISETEVNDPNELRSALDQESVTWVDIQGFGDGEIIRAVGEIFGLHELLLSDVVNVPQRPKAEDYEEHILIVVRMIWEGGTGFDQEQVSIVLGKHFVLTFQEQYGDMLDPVINRIRAGKGPLQRHGADYLAYTIADTIVDAYYPTLETLGDQLESLDDRVVRTPTPAVLQDLNRLKNRLVNLRRSLRPQREAFNTLVRGTHSLVSDEVRLHLRDTHDHCIQTLDVTEMYREMISGLQNTYLTSVANRTNEVMKVLTVVSTIFIPLTFLVGVYGMNFQHMPELQSRWGYPAVWVIMGSVAITMLAYFRYIGWLGVGYFNSSPKE
jgi:magnesium transporter